MLRAPRQLETTGHCMKILIYSRTFRPNIGGTESMMEMLAEEFTAAGHRVKVVTQIAAAESESNNHDYEVVRSPTLKLCVQLLRWSDVCLCANVSLRGLLPMMIAGTPLVISHHAIYGSPHHVSIVPEFKKTVTRFSHNICCSQAVQLHVPGRSIVIPNCYRSDLFREYSEVSKDLEIVFVGRLIRDKGIADLIDALAELGRTGFRPRLSIVGDGPGRPHILTRVKGLGLEQQVSLIGIRRGSELARFLARHRVMVVPSRCVEAFGLVAIEGIACGCVLVGSHIGGLPEAIGPCGITVPAESISALARAIKSLLDDDSLCARYRSCAQDHLSRHSPAIIARSYLKVLESAASQLPRARLRSKGLCAPQE
jgi:glycogen(starch) synthase